MYYNGKFKLASDFICNGVSLSEGTILTIEATKVNVMGPFDYMGKDLGWVSRYNPIWSRLEAI